MVGIILANVDTVICFRTGNPRDEQLLLPLFTPYIGQGEVSNLPSSYSFYTKLSAIKPQEPLSGHTLLLDSDGSEEVAKEVVRLSQEAFAGKQEQPAEVKEEPKKTPAKQSKQKRTKAATKAADKPAEGWIEDD